MRKGSHTSNEWYGGRHRFEHWYKGNQVYFITARVRARAHAFERAEAKVIFWRQFEKYSEKFGYVPWVTSLLTNHYHTLGYLRPNGDLPGLMKHFHGSVAKLVNDLLPDRIVPFWVDRDHQNYFDGCLRDAIQARRAYRYTLMQCARHCICPNHADYPHTRVSIEMERAIRRAVELGAFLTGVPYARYARYRSRRHGD